MSFPFSPIVAMILGVASIPAQSQNAPLTTECDRLTAHGRDGERTAPEVDTATLAAQADRAVAACRQAVSQNPEVRRFRFQLGRALWVAGKREESLAEMRRAAEAGSLAAMGWMASRHTDGTAGKVDHAEAARLYRIMADQGDAIAQANLAALYREGRSVPQDQAEEIKWLRRAADQGEISSLFNLATKHLYGTGVPRNAAEAARLFLSAARKGDPPSQASIGHMYLSGTGVAQNTGSAIVWLTGAAEQGDESAQATLGDLYFKGTLVPKDDPQAAKWLRKAAGNATPAGATARDTICSMLYGGRIGDRDAEAVTKICQGWTKAPGLRPGQNPAGIAAATAEPAPKGKAPDGRQPSVAAAEAPKSIAVPPQTPPAAQQLSAAAAEEPKSIALPPLPPLAAPLPNLKFSVKDPCDKSQWNQDGTLWQAGVKAAAAAPLPAIPVVRSPRLDVKTLSDAQFTAAVSTAMEAMRVLYGPLSKEDAAGFEAVWAPLYDHPAPQVVDYLNKLNPLLAQFLAGRAAMTEAVGAYQRALMDAALARSAGQDDVLFEDLAEAGRNKDSFLALQAGLAGLAAGIQALGNPPNPLELKCHAARRHANAVQARNDYLSRFETLVVHGAFAGRVGNEAEPKLYGIDITVDGTAGGQTAASGNSITASQAKEEPCAANDRSHICSHTRRIQLTLSADGKVLNEVRALRVSVSRKDGRDLGTSWDDLTLTGLPLIRGEIRPAWGIRIYGVRGPEALKHVRRHEGNLVLASTSTPRDDLWVAVGFGNPGSEMPAEVGSLLKWDGMVARTVADVSQSVLQAPGSVAGARPVPPGPQPDPGTAEPAPAATAAPDDKAEAEALQETIAFHRANIQIIDANLRAIRDDIREETQTPPRDERDARARQDRVKQLEFLALKAQSDIQAENDLIASYETGTLVHTRSAFDEYARANFVQSLRQEAERFNATLRIQRSVQKMVALLPEDQRKAAAAQMAEYVNPATVAAGDVEKARKAADMLGSVVQGYWQGQAAQAREEQRAAARAENQFHWDMAKMAAGTVLIGATPGVLVWKYGGEAAAFWWAPNVAGALFGGVTGVVKGGPAEAVREALSWSGIVGSLMVEAHKGFTEKDEQGRIAGWKNAAMQVGKTVLIGGAVMVGAHTFAKAAGSLRGASKPSWAEVVDMNRFEQEMSDARSLVNRYRETGAALTKARLGGAATAQIQALEKETRELAASLNSSYHCKWWLKHKGDKFTQGLFNGQVGAIHAEAHPRFLENLKQRNYDMSNIQFRPLRNEASKGNVDMDYDLALVETEGMVIRRRNAAGVYVEVSKEEFIKDAQRAYEEGYHAVTGFSGKRSPVLTTWWGHEEAYADLELLSRVPDWSKVRNMPQAATVTIGKARKFVHQEPLSMIARQQEACRTAAKDLETKVLPYLGRKLALAQEARNAAEVASIQEMQTYWKELQPRLARIGRAEEDPYKIWQGLQELRGLRQATGGRSVQQLLKDLRLHLMSIQG